MSTNTPLERVVLVGHCTPDSAMLRNTLSGILGDIEIVRVNDPESLEAAISPDALLLVNRVLEPGFDDDDGQALIRRLVNRAAPPRVMLISNYEDAQAEAVEAGALPGFGKSHLGKATTRQRLLAAAGRAHEGAAR